MSLWCTECANRVYVRKGCPRCGPMAGTDRVPPLDGYIWTGEGNEKPFDRGKDR